MFQAQRKAAMRGVCGAHDQSITFNRQCHLIFQVALFQYGLGQTNTLQAAWVDTFTLSCFPARASMLTSISMVKRSILPRTKSLILG